MRHIKHTTAKFARVDGTLTATARLRGRFLSCAAASGPREVVIFTETSILDRDATDRVLVLLKGDDKIPPAASYLATIHGRKAEHDYHLYALALDVESPS